MTAESLFFRDTDRGWGTGTGDSPDSETPVESVNLQGPSLPGDLSVPPHAKGLVMFAHGSGSSRFSPRNQAVAARLQRADLATVGVVVSVIQPSVSWLLASCVVPVTPAS